jgi:hypothetical protein
LGRYSNIKICLRFLAYDSYFFERKPTLEINAYMWFLKQNYSKGNVISIEYTMGGHIQNTLKVIAR